MRPLIWVLTIWKCYYRFWNLTTKLVKCPEIQNLGCSKMQYSNSLLLYFNSEWRTSKSKNIGIPHEQPCRIWISHPRDQTCFASVTRLCRVTWRTIISRVSDIPLLYMNKRVDGFIFSHIKTIYLSESFAHVRKSYLTWAKSLSYMGRNGRI